MRILILTLFLAACGGSVESDPQPQPCPPVEVPVCEEFQPLVVWCADAHEIAARAAYICPAGPESPASDRTCFRFSRAPQGDAAHDGWCCE